MSRSRRKTPIGPLTCSESNKEFKKQEHRRERSNVKRMLHMGYEEWELPHPKRYGNEWASPRDGKQYVGDSIRESYIESWLNGPLGHYWTREELVDNYRSFMRK